MNVSRRIQQNYEQRPYPPLDKLRRLRPVWRIAPLEWIEAMWQPSKAVPGRILVAGCGTGNEAFALRKRLPNAEIVAVDFSARTIALARARQRKFPSKNPIDFRRGDLTAKSFSRTVGGDFDFISCHGVLSYIPKPERALQNLTNLLVRDGALYLGVNGVRHTSETWRPVLQEFGLDPATFRDSRELRRLLKLCDALADHPAGRIATQSAEYLAGDLFGPLIANRPLEDWIALGASCGLQFRGSYSAHHTLRRALNSELFDQLIPRSRAEVHVVADRIAPSPFHPLVFAAKRAAEAPWQNQERLLRCGLQRTNLYTLRVSQRKRATRKIRVSLQSASTNTRVDLQVPAWVGMLLRDENSGRGLRDILESRWRRISLRSLRKHLYLLELLAVISLVPRSAHE